MSKKQLLITFNVFENSKHSLDQVHRLIEEMLEEKFGYDTPYEGVSFDFEDVSEKMKVSLFSVTFESQWKTYTQYVVRARTATEAIAEAQFFAGEDTILYSVKPLDNSHTPVGRSVDPNHEPKPYKVGVVGYCSYDGCEGGRLHTSHMEEHHRNERYKREAEEKAKLREEILAELLAIQAIELKDKDEE